jgi:hypothetical protein
MCKGAGMIHPQLVPHATMLVYILTDAAVEPALLTRLPALGHRGQLQPHLGGRRHLHQRHRAAAGLGRERAVAVGPENAAFASALTQVCTSLARQIVADGEGITHVVELRIEGAATDADALRIAKAIAHSPLVKTAWAGSDPNWGRLMASIGYSGAQIDPERIDIHFGELAICRDGGRAAEFDEVAAHAYIAQPEFSIVHSAPPGRRLLRLLDHRPDPRVRQHQRGLLDLGRDSGKGQFEGDKPPWLAPAFGPQSPAWPGTTSNTALAAPQQSSSTSLNWPLRLGKKLW